MKRLCALLVVLGASGCRTTATGYPFHSRGVYEAPKSAYRVEVLGEGRVAAGADVTSAGSGLARFCSAAGAVPLTLKVSGTASTASYELGPTRGSVAWAGRSREASLRMLLGKAGLSHFDAAELDESIRAIDGMLAGPKGTLLAGQTRSLRVVTTRLSRSAAPAPLTSSACGTF
ncbi:MAG: hypothetical protein R3B13_39460 [Polyangiaceae bacterium]